jgi:hypothetical protein
MTRCVKIGRLAAMMCLTVICMAATAQAEDSPAGNWKWTMTGGGGGGGTPRESKATFKVDGDKVTGTVTGGRNNTESAIEEGTFKDGTVAFQITSERNGQKRVVKYSGKVAGDTITGTVEFTGGQAGGMPREWKAERVKQ